MKDRDGLVVVRSVVEFRPNLVVLTNHPVSVMIGILMQDQVTFVDHPKTALHLTELYIHHVVLSYLTKEDVVLKVKKEPEMFDFTTDMSGNIIA